MRVWRRRWRKVLKGNAFLHRWVSLVLGVLLLLEVISGVVLLFRPELYQLGHQELFTATSSANPISQDQAVAAVATQHPEVQPQVVSTVHGVYKIETGDYTHQFYVDPGTGRVLGDGYYTHGFLAWMLNMHDCAFSCEGYTGYIPLMAKVIPGIDLNVGYLVLGVLGLAFVWVCIGGLIAWWPGVKRFAKGFVIHRKRGHYRFNRDLHDVAGFVTLPFLFMWALTGAGWELPFVADAWYAVTGTSASTPATPTSAPGRGKDITPSRAADAARRALPGGQVVDVTLPTSEATSTYVIFMHSGVPAASYGGIRSFGDTSVAVDRRTARATVFAGGPDAPLGRSLWDKWGYGIHFGYAVPWGWRLVWLVFGLAPLALAVTGFWTWWWRRHLRKVRRATRVQAEVSKGVVEVGASR